jgi:hypothetical protein
MRREWMPTALLSNSPTLFDAGAVASSARPSEAITGLLECVFAQCG